jgi:hypothetical protein
MPFGDVRFTLLHGNQHLGTHATLKEAKEAAEEHAKQLVSEERA